MACTDCRGSRDHLKDVRMLYNPGFFGNGIGQTSFSGSSARCNKKRTTSSGNCGASNAAPAPSAPAPPTEGGSKSFYSANCPAPLLRRYEAQPWFRNRIVQAEWKDFVDQLVTPTNIGPRLCPGPDDWEFKCHKARALIGPTVPCTWDLPEQDNKCGSTQYGMNRDWRRYNEDKRMEASEINCNDGCGGDAPRCASTTAPTPAVAPKTKGEGLPYMGKKHGARYVSWGYPGRFMPRPYRPV